MKLYKLVTGFLFLIYATIPHLPAQSLINLGDLGGGFSQANGINDSGQVVGYSSNSSGLDNAFLYSGGTMSNLGTLSGDVTSYATDINNAGQIVGYSSPKGFVNEYEDPAEAFLYSGGTMSSLGTPGTTLTIYNNSYATSINNSGTIVGLQSLNGVPSYFSYSNGILSPVSPPQGEATSYIGINNSGQIAGTNYGNAFLKSGGTVTSLGTLSTNPNFNFAYVTGINDLGQVVGWSDTTNNGQHAFLFSSGTMTDLGALGGNDSQANGINNAGQVVGSDLNGGSFDAFIYSSAEGMKDLNSLYSSLFVSGTGQKTGFTHLTSATAINSSGQIVGLGTYWNGTYDQGEAFLLNPVSTPEPASWALSIVAFASLYLLRHRVAFTDRHR